MAAERGHPSAMNNLGVMYEVGISVTPNLECALTLYEKAAEVGIAAAQNNLSVLLYNGTGVDKDVERAIEWASKAALQGSASLPILVQLQAEYQTGELILSTS